MQAVRELDKASAASFETKGNVLVLHHAAALIASALCYENL